MFVHLHVHSDNTILNGLMKVDKIVKKAKEYGMPAVAITDIGSMFSAVSFWQKCTGEGIKPIFGVQVNMAPRTRHHKEPKKDEKTSSLVLLAKNFTGYLNLIKIVSIGHLEGFYYKPRIDEEILEKYHEGLILLSGGPDGQIFKNLYIGNDEAALALAKKYKEIFGDDFYLEITRLGTHSEEVVEPSILELSKRIGIQIVATNDVYYEKQEDSEAREVLWCIDSGRLMSDPARRKPDSDQQYFRSAEEMIELFKDLPEAIENTLKINDKIETFSISYGKVQPIYPKIPEVETEESYLRKLVYENAPKKFGYWNEELEKQIEYELKVIHEKGYDGYFLVVWDVANWARSHGVSVNARGSAAGASIAYALGISTVDPIKWKLFFERFLNPERKSLPDIDLDIADNKRDELINYIKETYGSDCVVNVCALGKLTTKAAIRDVGRVLGIELNIIDKLSKLVPVKFGRVLGINAMIADEIAGKDIKVVEEYREKVNEFRELIKEDGRDLKEIKFCPKCQKTFFDTEDVECKTCHEELKVIAKASARLLKLLKYVQKIEGCVRNISTHACGYLITAPHPIINYCPVQRESGSRGRIITQFEGKYLEEVGLMKFDFLGVANLSIIDNAVKFVKKNKGIDLDIYHLDEADEKTFELLRKSDTTAVFQLESAGMKKYLRELEPHNLEEISAMLALYRPGPIKYIPAFINRKHGREETQYLIPEIEDIMKVTYGLPVYQEQILQIANRLAGYSLGEADNLRRAIGKKLPEVMAAEEKRFKEGFLKNYPHYGQEIADKLWEYAIPFADYGFNKSHTAAYALISYQTAYLKANHPTEFYAALMLSDIDKLDKLTRDILEAKSHGIKLLPPSVNKSDAFFTIKEEGVIRFGIGGMKGVGLNAIQSLVEERKKNGEFKSLDDLCFRIDHKTVSKGVIEALIKVGAMDEFGTRAGLLEIFEEVYTRSQKMKATRSYGSVDMFGTGIIENEKLLTTKVPKVPEVDDSQKIEWEKAILGVAVTQSLIMKLTPYLQSKGYKSNYEIQESHFPDQTPAKVFGQITRKNEITTKNGDLMCFLETTDSSGSISTTLFPRVYEKCGEFNIGDYVSIKGKTQKRNEEWQIIADEIKIVKENKLKSIWEKLQTTLESENSKTKRKKEKNFSFARQFHLQKSDEIPQNFNKSQENTRLQEVNHLGEEYKPQINTLEIKIKKDADIEALKKLSEYLRSKIQDNGIEIFLCLPNHESIRIIKLEGKYSPEIQFYKDDIIEEISGKLSTKSN